MCRCLVFKNKQCYHSEIHRKLLINLGENQYDSIQALINSLLSCTDKLMNIMSIQPKYGG